jgi:hypothetical protein
MTFQAPDLPVKFEAFREALEWASGVKIFWRHQSLEGRHREANEVWGELQIFNIQKLGIDDIRYVETGVSAAPLKATQCGNRILKFQLNMRSRSQEHRQTGWYAATKAQQRINSPFVRTKWLDANELALATVGDVIDAPDGFEWDNRVEDIAVLEFDMNTILTDVDDAAVVGCIETIKASTGFKNVDGNDWPSSLQLDDEVMP